MTKLSARTGIRSDKYWWIIAGVAIGLIVGLWMKPAPADNDQAVSGENADSSASAVADVEVGSQGFAYAAPDFSLMDDRGDMVNLESFHGQPVLVNFWASWCPPCRQEMATFEAYYQRYGNEGLAILAVNSDDSMDVISSFRKQNGLSFHLLQDENKKTMEQYAVIGLPSSFFIDRDGRIVNRHVGLLTDDLLDQYFAELGLEP